VEVCVDSVETAITAEKSHAVRVELCADLYNGGTTPSYGMIHNVRNNIRIPLFVLIRPRGGDFCYSEADFNVMLFDIEMCSKLKVNGVVFGVLQANGDVDITRTKIFVEKARLFGMSVTFHRAFDMTRDPFSALQTLIDLGVDRVLTSGQRSSCIEGLLLLKAITEKANNRIIIVPGGGISETNVKAIVEACNVKEFHVSARIVTPSKMVHRNLQCVMGGSMKPDEYTIFYADPTRITNFLLAANGNQIPGTPDVAGVNNQ